MLAVIIAAAVLGWLVCLMFCVALARAAAVGDSDRVPPAQQEQAQPARRHLRIAG